jgi:TolA-binding protein
MLKLSNYEGAVLSFLNFKRNFSNSKLLDDATYALGLAYFQKQDYNSSREIFRKFVEEFKDSNLAPEAMYLLGTSLYNLGEFNQAIEVFKNIVRLYSENSELVQKAEYEIADAYYQMGNEKEAMSRFNMLRAKYPDSNLTAEIMWWLGEYYYRQNDLNLALRYFSSLIRDFPNSNLIPDTYYALGSIYTQDSKYSEAISNFQKVIEIGKSDLAGQAAIAIADIYVRQEKFDLAIDTYKDKVKEYPNLTHLIYPKLGDIFFKLTKYDEALEFYYKSLDLVPVREMAEIHFKIAETQQTQGKIREAIEEYLKVPYLYSENKDLGVKAFLRVAKVYEEEEKFKEAINIYKKVITMEVPEAKYAQERIDALEKQK